MGVPDVIGILCLGFGALWGARMGFVRAVAVGVTVGVAGVVGSLYGPAMADLLVSAGWVRVEVEWVALLAGRVLVGTAVGAGVFALGSAFELMVGQTPVLGRIDRLAGLIVGLGMGMMTAVWIGETILGMPVLPDLAYRSYLLQAAEVYTAFVDRVREWLFSVTGLPGS